MPDSSNNKNSKNGRQDRVRVLKIEKDPYQKKL